MIITFISLDRADLGGVRRVLGEFEHPSLEASYRGEGARDFYANWFNFPLEYTQLAYDLARHGRLLITVEPGPPDIIAVNGEDIAADYGEAIVHVSSADELRRVLSSAS